MCSVLVCISPHSIGSPDGSSSPPSATASVARRKPGPPKGPRPVGRRDRLNLSSEHFDSQVYVEDLLATRGLRQLVDTNNDLASTKRALDSEMQVSLSMGGSVGLSTMSMRSTTHSIAWASNPLIIPPADHEDTTCTHTSTNQRTIKTLVGPLRHSIPFLTPPPPSVACL